MTARVTPSLTPFQKEEMLKLPSDGRPAPVSEDAAFAFRSIKDLVWVEEVHDPYQHIGGLMRHTRLYRACLLAAGIKALPRRKA